MFFPASAGGINPIPSEVTAELLSDTPKSWIRTLPKLSTYLLLTLASAALNIFMRNSHSALSIRKDLYSALVSSGPFFITARRFFIKSGAIV